MPQLALLVALPGLLPTALCCSWKRCVVDQQRPAQPRVQTLNATGTLSVAGARSFAGSHTAVPLMLLHAGNFAVQVQARWQCRYSAGVKRTDSKAPPKHLRFVSKGALVKVEGLQ